MWTPHLKKWGSIDPLDPVSPRPLVLVAGAIFATQNSPFSSIAMAVTITSTVSANPQRDGEAELAWVAGYVVRQFTCP